MSETPIRAVFFDAVGTLIHPEPPAADVYAAAARGHGSRLTPHDIRDRFRQAFRRQDDVDRQHEWRTSEQREIDRWRSIVFEVLDDVVDREDCFRELYEHFARPASWRCDGADGQLVAELASHGYLVGLASNFDERLRRVAAGVAELAAIRHLVISAEVSWRKPSRRFFEAMCRTVGLSPAEVLYVGDDRENDLVGALAAGCRAALLDPVGQQLLGSSSIKALTELRCWLGTLGQGISLG
jgi:putative hydrolase of the HAD superfamily